MSSAAKTLELLSYFSTARPEIGLSQLCRLAQRDKATTYRHLQTLEVAGFIEQNPLTKRYRLGPVVLQLAHTREFTVPRKSAAESVLTELSNATGETCHVSVLSGTAVYALCSCESPEHSIRVIIDIPTFPLHATASGLCTLAFSSTDLLEVAYDNLHAYTANTASSKTRLNQLIKQTRETGFSIANRSLEDEVCSIAAPVFDQTGFFAGAVSVASVASRFTPELEHCIQQQLVKASREITRQWGGTIPEDIEALWSTTMANSQMVETAE